MNEQSSSPPMQGNTGWRVAGWILLGALIGGALVGAFFAYGQPELLLEQLNLRYCG
jgi:hypothetical protein